MSSGAISRRNFIKTAAATVGACTFPAVLRAAPTARRPNVLFIAVDDMNCDASCFGGLAPSPHLTRLARQGVRFDRSYCQYPLCSPSRTSLLTGLRPDQTRVYDLQTHFRTHLPDVVTLPQLFRNHGYYAGRVGKIYHIGNPGRIGTAGLDDPLSWTETFNPAGIDSTALLQSAIDFTPSLAGATSKWGEAIAYLEDEMGHEEDYADSQVATRAIELLERRRKDPFFLAVGFYKPHCPYIVPKRYFDQVDRARTTIPPWPANYESSVPKGALASTHPWPLFGVSPEQAMTAKRAYYAAIAFVDAQIGRVLAALDRTGQRENTIVVFWSDHGYHVGDHGLWFKESCFEGSARVPVIIAPPQFRHGGAACQRIVEHVDLYPTLADLAGLPVASHLPGTSLRPLLADPTSAWNRPAYTQVQREGFLGWSVRTERWRYTMWNAGHDGDELYDHEADPGEMTNLSASPRHRDIIRNCRDLVARNWPQMTAGGAHGS